MEQLSRNRIDMINVALVFLAGLVVGAILGYVLFGLPSAHGVDANTSMFMNAYVQNVTNQIMQTEGNMIDMYIANVKPDICSTLNNTVEEKECMMI